MHQQEHGTQHGTDPHPPSPWQVEREWASRQPEGALRAAAEAGDAGLVRQLMAESKKAAAVAEQALNASSAQKETTNKRKAAGSTAERPARWPRRSSTTGDKTKLDQGAGQSMTENDDHGRRPANRSPTRQCKHKGGECSR